MLHAERKLISLAQETLEKALQTIHESKNDLAQTTETDLADCHEQVCLDLRHALSLLEMLT